MLYKQEAKADMKNIQHLSTGRHKCCDPASGAGQAAGTMPLVHWLVTKKFKQPLILKN
jgi:hypothetical protein